MEEKNKEKAFFVDWRKSKKVPDPSEKSNNAALPYVSWGRKNDYPLFLNTLYEKSPSQTGIINSKVNYLTAGGFTIVPKVKTPEIEEKIKRIVINDPSDISLADVVSDNFTDRELYNGFAIRGVWNVLTGEPSFLESIDFDEIRTNEEQNRFWISEDWTQQQQSFEKTGFREIRPIDLSNKEGEFIIYVAERGKKTGRGRRKVYPTPPYSGCIESLMSEIEYQSYHFYETQNGFKTGTIVSILSPKPKGDREKKLISDQIKAGSTSAEAAGGVLVLFSEGGVEHPTVLNLTGNDLDKRYLQTETATANTILKAHSIGTPSLFGMLVPGQLGNTQELKNGFDIFVETYVKNRQKAISETYTWILKNCFGIDAEFRMNLPKNPFSETSEAVSSGEKMSAKDPILKALEKAGRKKEGFAVKSSRPVPFEFEEDWFSSSEEELMKMAKEEKNFFAIVLNEIQKNVLALVGNGEDILSISKALNISTNETLKAFDYLVEKGLIKKNGELSESGKKRLDTVEAPVERFEIRYSYELRPDAPALRGESRPFCKAMLSLDKLYTREEIETISAAVDRNVWKYRGGWYHNPTTDKNTPYCRHTWFQHLVLKK